LKERLDYKKVLKEYRLRNIKEYWARQTQVENEYIEKWNKMQEEKAKRDAIELRATVVRISAGTQHTINEKKKNEEKRMANLQKHLLNEELKRNNRAQILKMLNFDSKTWFTLDNIEQKMVDKVLIPENVYNETSYYHNLQELAILYETADFKGMEQVLNDSLHVRSKNAKLGPLYTELVSVIKDITFDEAAQYIEDYNALKIAALKNDNLTEEERDAKIAKLKTNYGQLIEQYKEEANHPSNRINSLHKQLICLHKLLQVWESYITVLKMDRYQFEIMEKQSQESRDIKIVDEDQDGGRRDPLKAEHFSDAVFSANEKATSDSDAEIDISKENAEELLENPKKMKEYFELIQEREKEKAAKEAEPKDTIKEEEYDFNEASSLFDRLLEKDTSKLEKKFEEEFAEAEDKERFIYGRWRETDAIDAEEFIHNNTIESFIPESEIKQARNFDKASIKYQAELDSRKQEETSQEENYNKLNSTPLAAAYKRELEELAKTESLTRKEMNKIQEIRKLLTKVEEIRVDEGRLLLKVFEMYRYRYQLD